MHSKLITSLTIASLSLIAVPRAFSQGALTPPPGAPAPSMKTLNEVEPRIPIGVGPFVISQPGSYYLTNNITANTTLSIITITSSDVTLDLNGFNIHADPNGYTAAFGVWVSGSGELANITIKNGTISGCRTGVSFSDVNGSEISSLRISNAISAGIRLYGGSDGVKMNGNLIKECQIDQVSDGDGILIKLDSGVSNGNRIESCMVRGVVGAGLSGCGIRMTSNSGCSYSGNTISGCAIQETAEKGVSLDATDSDSCKNNTVKNNNVIHVSGYGLYLREAKDWCMEGNVISSTQSMGILATNSPDGRLEGNLIRVISDYGVNVNSSGHCVITNNHVSGFISGTGSATYGFRVANSADTCIVGKNSSVGASHNFDFTSGVMGGIEVPESGAIGATTATHANPWANFNLHETP